MTSALAICARLAVLARSGYPIRAALIELPNRLEIDAPDVAVAARRARLGAPIRFCLAPMAESFGDALPRLQACLGVAGSSGSDWARALEELSGSMEARIASERAAEVAGAGATLSARIIGALPLLLVPVAVRRVGDPIVAGSIAVGLVLGVVGYRWLMRIVPKPAPEDAAVAVADEVAASIGAGMSLHDALTEAARARPELASAVRAVRLGSSWSSALSEEFPELADALRDASRSGLPVAAAIRRAAAAARARVDHAFERRVQRAPVKMVMPLVFCILPSFVFTALIPLLSGLAHPV